MNAKILKLALAISFALVTSGNIMALKRGPGLVDSIPGITKEQKIKIAGLREAWRIDMQELQTMRNSAENWEAKDKIDRQMLEKRIEHRNAVRNVLNDEQKKYFDQNFDRPMHKKGGNPDKDWRKHKRPECPRQPN